MPSCFAQNLGHAVQNVTYFKRRPIDIKTNPDNYRGISILSCIGKLFTSILKKRLSDFLDHFKINGLEQAGFKLDFPRVILCMF